MYTDLVVSNHSNLCVAGLEAEVCQQELVRVALAPKALEESPFLLLPVSGDFRCSWACGYIILISGPVFTSSSPPLSMCLTKDKDTVTVFRAHQVHQDDLIFQSLIISARSLLPNKFIFTGSSVQDTSMFWLVINQPTIMSI